MSTKQGFGLIELILALGLFTILATAAIVSILGAYGINRLADQETEATLYAQEGIEAVISLKNRDWDNVATGTYGLTIQNNLWKFSGSSDSNGIFTRSVTVSTVNRDCDANIVASGGKPDTNAFKVSSSVSWSPRPTKTNTVTLETWLTNTFRSWQNSTQMSVVNLTANDNGLKIGIHRCYALVIRDGTTADNFVVVDINDPFNASIVGSLLLDNRPVNIAVSGNYAYIVSQSDSQELQVVNFSTATAPTLAGTVNLTGSSNMTGVYIVGTNAYLTRVNNGAGELYVIDISTPSSPSQIGTLEIGTTINDIYCSGNYCYLVRDLDATEVVIVDISTPSTPTLAATFGLSGNANGRSVDGFTDRIVVGRQAGGVDVVNVTNPLVPSTIGTFSSGGDVNDVAVGFSNPLMLLATSNNTAEFQVVDLADNTLPVLLESYNAAQAYLGATYDPLTQKAAVVGASDTQELIIYGAL